MRLPVRSKLVVLSAAAVVLPAVALTVLQYRSLVQLESKTRVAVRDELVRAGRNVGRNAQAEMERLAAEALSGFSAAELTKSVAELGQRFRALRQAHAEIDQVVLYSAEGPDGAFAVLSTRDGAQRFT